MYGDRRSLVFFFFNDTATTEIYTLSLHDALPICDEVGPDVQANQSQGERVEQVPKAVTHLLRDHDHSRGKEIGRAQRLNSSHSQISYAVFCLKKKIQTHYLARLPTRLPIEHCTGL